MQYKGIDVSWHNGNIKWDQVKKNIDFAIIRAGYGKNKIDSKAEQNIKGCIANGIPFGLYWFSYALSENMARDEANYVCNLADKYSLKYPICYDWEYDSDNYAKQQGVKITNETRKGFAQAFLAQVEKRGYYAMLYTNIDYLSKGFSGLITRYDVWLAQWDVSSPSKGCGIWQKTSKGKINGITGNVDIDIAFKNYPSICNKLDENKKLETVKKEFWDKYMAIAYDIISGKYGSGEERKKKIEKLGYDYAVAQSIVNCIMG